MKVFAYREVIKSKQFDDTDSLIELWKTSWMKHGWDPILLGIKEAKKHPLYKRLNPAYEALPSVNHAQYEAACFRRWLAASQSDALLMVDYDVINYGFTPEDFNKLRDTTALNNPLQLITLSGWCCPCAVYSSNFTTAALLFASWKPTRLDAWKGKKHVSDQSILNKSEDCFDTVRICSSPSDKGWRDFPLAHYSNASMQKHQPRSEWIPKLRPI